jgi:type II secretory pathway pseudopilin PulG
LVVIAIIAILIGLLLPAVQKVREAAARTKCSNNLKQIVLAAHMYQDQNNRLPAGWVTSSPAGAVAPSPGWSWAVLILPNMEQGALYNVIGPSGAPPDLTTPNGPFGPTPVTISAPTVAQQTPLKTYRCPSDPGLDLNSQFQNFGMNNYVCNREVLGPGRTDGSNVPNALAIQSIPDGSSNTILFGERDTVKNCGAVYVRSSSSSASFEGRPGYGINPKKADGTPYTTGNNERLAYSSNHTGGAQFAMGDGRVIFISQSVDADSTDLHVNFPACMSGATTKLCQSGTVGMNSNFTLQKLQHPADNLPVNLP